VVLGITPQRDVNFFFLNIWNNAHESSNVFPNIENTTLGQIEFPPIWLADKLVGDKYSYFCDQSHELSNEASGNVTTGPMSSVILASSEVHYYSYIINEKGNINCQEKN
jgi:hypothetical protein